MTDYQKLSELFEGDPGFLGGLSNEHKLVGLCPDEFKTSNSWSEYASRLFFMGASIKNWKWKSSDKQVQGKQISCFKGLLATFSIQHKDKEAVAGWMLSAMLLEVPEYLKLKK